MTKTNRYRNKCDILGVLWAVRGHETYYLRGLSRSPHNHCLLLFLFRPFSLFLQLTSLLLPNTATINCKWRYLTPLTVCSLLFSRKIVAHGFNYPISCEAKTSVSPRSSLLGTFRVEVRLRLSGRNSILMTQINVYVTRSNRSLGECVRYVC